MLALWRERMVRRWLAVCTRACHAEVVRVQHADECAASACSSNAQQMCRICLACACPSLLTLLPTACCIQAFHQVPGVVDIRKLYIALAQQRQPIIINNARSAGLSAVAATLLGKPLDKSMQVGVCGSCGCMAARL